MNSQVFAALALLSLGAAQVANSIDAVASGASTLSEQVAAYSSAQGIAGALGIQGTYYPAFSSQVVALKDALGSASSSDITTENAAKIVALETNVSALLDTLANKAADFTAVGAKSIVQGDVQGLYQPSLDIASTLLSLASGQCDILSSVTPGLASMDAAFSLAASSYGFDGTAFPTADACEASSTSESSTETSATETSTSESSTETSATETSTSESSTETSATETSTSESSTETSATETTPAGSTQRCLVRPTGTEAPVTSYIVA